MNQERSHSEDKSSWQLEKINQARRKHQVSLTQLLEADQNTEQLPNSPQSIPLNRSFWFWRQHSGSFFSQGLFWGAIVGLTAVSSAIGGVALTKIDSVEQAIASKIQGKSLNTSSVTPKILSRPINVLLLEVKSGADAMTGLSETLGEDSKAILLLKIEPQQDLAQVINIPNNSKVEIPGHGQGTINDAYQLGGIKLLTQTINQLNPDSTVDYYIRANPETFRKLSASGKITLEDCDSRIDDCSHKLSQVIRQQTTFNMIRQRLNIPGYLASFKTAIAQAEANLDTNISVPEIISLATFVKELDPKNINVDLLPEYTPGKSITQKQQEPKLPPIKKPQNKLASISDISSSKSFPFQYSPIAVQNTTDNPELGKRVVAYLRHRNFRDVYLVPQIPLKLNQTRIVSHHSQTETASYLQNILGFGHLAEQSDISNRELTLQIGSDAFYLPTNYRSYNGIQSP